MPRNRLLCHIVDEDLNEIAIARTKTQAQEFSALGRMWAIPQEAKDVFIRDKKGVKHLYGHINEADGIFHFLTAKRLNMFAETMDEKGNYNVLDKCGACGDRISIDARSVRDLLKRKTISTFWGTDTSYIMILLLLGILAMGAVTGAFYLFGQNTALQNELRIYKPVTDMVYGALMFK